MLFTGFKTQLIRYPPPMQMWTPFEKYVFGGVLMAFLHGFSGFSKTFYRLSY